MYGLVLRYLVFKLPTSVELLDWMIGLDDESLTRTAYSVLYGTEIDEELMPIIVLMTAAPSRSGVV